MAREPPLGKPIRAAFFFLCPQFFYRRASEAAWSPKPRPEGSTPSAGACFPALVSAAPMRATRVRPRSSVDRVAASEAAGRRFDSCRGHQPTRRGGRAGSGGALVQRYGSPVFTRETRVRLPDALPGRRAGARAILARSPRWVRHPRLPPWPMPKETRPRAVAPGEAGASPAGHSRARFGNRRGLMSPANVVRHHGARRHTTDPCHDGHEAACKAAVTGFDSRAGLRTAETVGAPV